MCLFVTAQEKAQEASEAKRKAIASLKEATPAQLKTVTAAIGTDKPKKTNKNVSGGFKVTSKANLKTVKAAKTRRENSLNTDKGKSRVVEMVKASPRIKSLVLTEKKNGKNKGDWLGTVRFLVA